MHFCIYIAIKRVGSIAKILGRRWERLKDTTLCRERTWTYKQKFGGDGRTKFYLRLGNTHSTVENLPVPPLLRVWPPQILPSQRCMIHPSQMVVRVDDEGSIDDDDDENKKRHIMCSNIMVSTDDDDRNNIYNIVIYNMFTLSYHMIINMNCPIIYNNRIIHNNRILYLYPYRCISASSRGGEKSERGENELHDDD